MLIKGLRKQEPSLTAKRLPLTSDLLSLCIQHYSSHSFRIGAASTSARLGISDQTIQILGRWSSQAYHTYIRNNLNDLRQAHAQLSSI
ncbi:hypothetical protein KUCAC02_006111 [Chaenocephalus aceratus]|uniref:Uncharacterized protein n=1 Tax=Chaenocephalus aceratus TaxID=36190 RepID=A0ACB9WRF3_CHAAC|nr:hypothetical protein KUCAC02_006111 [Chaenocephalus aceratus]